MTARGRPTRPLVVLGYQGHGNLGDEAILTGIEALLAPTSLRIGWVVSGPAPDTVAAYPDAQRLVAPRLVPTLAALRALRASGGLLLAGGGLIHDHWPTIVPRFLAWIVLARLLGRPVVWLGVGVGPLRRRSQRMLARLASSLSTLVLVRDDASATALGRGSEGVVPDPALFNAPPSSAGARSGILVVVREPVRATETARAALADRIVTTVAAIERTGGSAAVAVMAGPADAAIVEAISAAARARGAEVAVEALGPRPPDVLDRLAACEAVLSIRLHGILLAALARTPTVGVAYDAKVRGVTAALAMEDLVLDPDQLGTDAVAAAIDAALAPGRAAAIRESVEILRTAGPEIARRVEAAFRGAA